MLYYKRQKKKAKKLILKIDFWLIVRNEVIMEKLKQIPKKDILKIIVFAVILMLILGTTIYAVRNNNKKTVETDGEII